MIYKGFRTFFGDVYYRNPRTKGTQNDIISISKEDWTAIQETIYLNAIPGYVDSINEVLESSRDEWVNAKELGL